MNLALRRHLPFAVGLVAGGIAFLSILAVPLLLATVIAANMFFAVYLSLTLSKFPRLSAEHLRDNASADDEPVWIIFLVTLGAVAAAVAALFVLINKAAAPAPLTFALALGAVPLGWFTIHTMAAIHYAHVFWQPDGGGNERRRGLEFPGSKDPAGIDFLYFACVTGMTAQTSDVAITTSRMRGINLVHAVASFFFNTVLVAAAVNLAVSLGQ